VTAHGRALLVAFGILFLAMVLTVRHDANACAFYVFAGIWLHNARERFQR
jgi:hypothetical protein